MESLQGLGRTANSPKYFWDLSSLLHFSWSPHGRFLKEVLLQVHHHLEVEENICSPGLIMSFMISYDTVISQNILNITLRPKESTVFKVGWTDIQHDHLHCVGWTALTLLPTTTLWCISTRFWTPQFPRWAAHNTTHNYRMATLSQITKSPCGFRKHLG